MSREESPVPEGSSNGSYGTLVFVGKKSGSDFQTFPIDAERITIGRDYDCDVRLYFSDVSKLHAEIIFDLLTNRACLHVHGSSGVHHGPVEGSTKHYHSPAVVPLESNDRFIIRRKVFRFEYCESQAIPTHSSQIDVPTSTPVIDPHSTVAFPSPPRPSRRRASHRLSLVPRGRDFVPHSPANKKQRRNTLSTSLRNLRGDGSQVEEEVQEEEDNEEELIDVVDGEEGDRVYLEAKEPSTVANAIYDHPFMTPQPTRKQPLQTATTGPADRQAATFLTTPTNGTEESFTGQASPTSPTSASALSPNKIIFPMPEPTSKIARSTPKGSPSLWKNLLVRSARKAWEESRGSGLDGAIANGSIIIRRKSSSGSPSPKHKSAVKTLTIPIFHVDPPEEDEPTVQVGTTQEGIEEDAEEKIVAEQEAQWIQETGIPDVSLSESDSDKDSLEADISLDIPGQSVFDASPLRAAGEESMEAEEPIEDVNYQTEEEEFVEWQDLGAETQAEPTEDAEDSDQVADMVFALPGTPAANRAMSQFYTPQTRKQNAGQRSLATIGGPATRYIRPDTNGLQRAPGSMGRPSRIVIPAEPVESVEEIPSTPAQRPGAIRRPFGSEARRARENVATPREPRPTPSTFKTPVRDTSLRGLKSLHPALNTSATEQGDKFALPRTPMADIKRRLTSLRKQGMASASKAQTKTPIKNSLTATSRRPNMANSATFSTMRATRQPSQSSFTFQYAVPKTPVVQAQQGNDVPSLPQSPDEQINRPMAVPASPAREPTPDPESDEEMEKRDRSMSPPSVPPSLSYTGLRDMLKPLAPPKTPVFTGLTDMFAPSTSQPTPSYWGLRNMFRAEPVVPPTPNFVGLKEMMHERPVPPTPAMDGLADMFNTAEVDETETKRGESSKSRGSRAVSGKSVKSTGTSDSASQASRGSKRSARGVSTESEAPVETVKSASGTVRGRGGQSKAKSVEREDITSQEAPSETIEKTSRSNRTRPPAKADTEDKGSSATQSRPAKGKKPTPAPQDESEDELAAPPSPAASKTTRGKKVATINDASSKSSARSRATSSSSRSKKAAITQGDVVVEIIKSSPPRPTGASPKNTNGKAVDSPSKKTKGAALVDSPVKSRSKRTGKPLANVETMNHEEEEEADEVFDLPSSKSASSRGSKSTSTSGRWKGWAIEEVKENVDVAEGISEMGEMGKKKKGRQSTVASRTRSKRS